MSPHRRQPPRYCARPTSGAVSAPRVITIPEPSPLPTAISTITAVTPAAVEVSGSRKQATATDRTTGTATTARPRRSISQPPGKKNRTSIEGGHREDQRGGAGRDADPLGPQRQQAGADRPGRADHDHGDAQGEQGLPVGDQHRPHRTRARPRAAPYGSRRRGRASPAPAAPRPPRWRRRAGTRRGCRPPRSAARRSAGRRGRPTRKVPPSSDIARARQCIGHRVDEVALAGDQERRPRRSADRDARGPAATPSWPGRRPPWPPRPRARRAAAWSVPRAGRPGRPPAARSRACRAATAPRRTPRCSRPPRGPGPAARAPA